MDHFGVILHLQLIAGGLGILIGADTAIGTDAELFLAFLGHQITLGGDNLNLLLGAIGVGCTDGILLRLPVLIATSTGAKWCFLYYLHAVHPLPLHDCGSQETHQPQQLGFGAVLIIPESSLLVFN